jgi:hypothetical protein
MGEETLKTHHGKIPAIGIVILFLITTCYSSTIYNADAQKSVLFKDRNITWDVSISYNEPGGAYDTTVFGEAPDAHDGPPVDPYDVLKPPAPMPSYIRAWFDDNLPIPYNKLWKDYRHYPGITKVWDLTVRWVPDDDVSPTTITISWNPTIVDTSEYTSVNLCTSGGVVLKNMLIDSSYTFICPAEVNQIFKINCLLNHAPNTPNTPTPVNQSTDVNFTTDLSWNGGDPDGDTVTYDVYFGDINPPPIVAVNQSLLTYNPGTLDYLQTYYWRIIAWDEHGASASGPLWHFTTEEAPNHPPNVPNTPNPTNGQIDVSVSTSLQWSGGDPDGDPVTYDVFFGTTSPPPKVVSNQSGLIYDPPGNLNYLQTYYWKIVAWDDQDASASGLVWYFTTQEMPNLPPVFGTPSPSNSSTNNPLSLTWSIPINDPEGDAFSWSIQCNNGQMNSSTGATNGTKSVQLSGLLYSTAYKVWVNATDPVGSNLYTRRWYTFATKADSPPNTPNAPTPPDGATDVIITTDIQWHGGDPDGDPVTYDVYFGTTTPPLKVVSNQSSLIYHPGTLAYNRTYYWKIVAWDNQGATAGGPIWSFTTKPDTIPPVVKITNPEKGFIYVNFSNIIVMKIPFLITLIIGPITVTADAYDNESGIQRVEFYLDDDLKYTDTEAPYVWHWTGRDFFPYNLKAVAYDNFGNSNSDTIRVWHIQIFS